MFFHKDGGSNFVVTNFLSKTIIFISTRANMKWDGVNTGHAQVIGGGYPTVLLYILLDRFITVQVTHKTLYHQVTLNVIFVSKRLHQKPFNTATLWNLKTDLGGLNM